MKAVPPDTRPVELPPALLRAIEDIAAFFETYGLSRIGGRIFGVFLVSSRPLTAQQVADIIGASRGSISTNMRLLLAGGWVERITYPGERAEFFFFSPNAWERAMERRAQGIAPLKALAVQAQKALPKGDPAHSQLEQMVSWTDVQVEHYERLLTAWRARPQQRTQRAARANGKPGRGGV
jgi:DNA-binding transcriptional regulator GbsR (MarR family)